jgi:hypothetical protein
MQFHPKPEKLHSLEVLVVVFISMPAALVAPKM